MKCKHWLLFLMLYTFIINTIFCCSQPVVEDYSKIDSLELIIDSLRNNKDTLFIVRDSIHTEIIKIQSKYETLYMDVDTQSVNSDIQFFTEYLSKNY